MKNYIIKVDLKTPISLFHLGGLFRDYGLLSNCKTYHDFKKKIFLINLNIDCDANQIKTILLNNNQNYLKNNDQIVNLQKLVHLRNYKIIQILLRSGEWKEFIIKFKNKCNETNTKNVENAFIKLLEKYLGTWNTIDKFIILDKKNSIKTVEIVDPDDYEQPIDTLNITPETEESLDNDFGMIEVIVEPIEIV
jgi:hypothetical protein